MNTFDLLAFPDVMQNVLYIALAILMLMVMITVHEFGHYIVGKILHFKITEFAIGMGPAIFKKTKKNGEIFSLRLLPVGGFCSFSGEDEKSDDPDDFNNKKPWQRILVLIAGATMNYLLALVVIMISVNVYGLSTLGVQVAAPTDGLSAEYAEQSLESGDFILSLSRGGKKTEIYLPTDLVSALNHGRTGDVVYAEIIRGEDGEISTVPVKLRFDVECRNLTEVGQCYAALGFGTTMQVAVSGDEDFFKTGDYIIKYASEAEYKDCPFIFDAEDMRAFLADKAAGDGVSFYVSRDGERVKLDSVLSDKWNGVDKTSVSSVLGYFGITNYEVSYYTDSAYRKTGFFRSIGRSFNYSFKIGGTIFRTLGELLTGRLGIKSVGGTVTTIVTTSKVMRYGLVYAMEIMAFIGVNLALFNLLPIPALDGSRVVFCVIEWIRRKPINRKVEAIIHGIGFILIFGFAILVDVLQFI